MEDPFEEMMRELDIIRKKSLLPLKKHLMEAYMPTYIPVDLEERENELVATIDLPGFNKKDIKIELVNNSLIVKGEKKEEKEEKSKKYYFKERSYGSFYRTISLPVEVNPEEVKATYKDGVLTVVMKKAKKSKNVEINIE